MRYRRTHTYNYQACEPWSSPWALPTVSAAGTAAKAKGVFKNMYSIKLGAMHATLELPHMEFNLVLYHHLLKRVWLQSLRTSSAGQAMELQVDAYECALFMLSLTFDVPDDEDLVVLAPRS